MMKKLLAVFTLLTLAACQADAPIEWHMVNVNHTRLQGDAHILVSGDKAFMIDAGYAEPAQEKLIPFLKKHHIKSIQHAFVSHPHRDHYEGFAIMLDNGINIDNIHYNIPASDISDCCYDKNHFLKHIQHWRKFGVITHQVNAEESFKLGRSELSVIHVQRKNLPDQNIDVNDLSLIMKWTIDDQTVLFSGDLNVHIGQWLATHKTKELKADVLKVPHHGGYGIAPDAFFEAVDPKQMMVSGPKWIWCGKRGAQARNFGNRHQIKT